MQNEYDPATFHRENDSYACDTVSSNFVTNARLIFNSTSSLALYRELLSVVVRAKLTQI